MARITLAVSLVIVCAGAVAWAGDAARPRFDETWHSSQGAVIRIGEGAAAMAEALAIDKPQALSERVTVRTSLYWDRIRIYDSGAGAEVRGSANKRARQEIPVEGAISALTTGDFNQDGISDFAVADIYTGEIHVYCLESNGMFVRRGSARVGSCPSRIAAGDFDGDGRLDVATANFADGSISIASGTGDGRLKRAHAQKTGPGEAASRVFAPAASAAVDYSALKSALDTTAMGSSTRRKLKRLVSQSEKSYNHQDVRAAVSRLEKFVRLVKRVSDSALSSSSRSTLVTLAGNIIDELLGGGGGSTVSVSISANPSNISPGGSSTLTWSSTGAVSAVINNGVGSVATSGSQSVSPAATTTYTIVATGSDGSSAQASATVTVGVTGTIFVNPTTGSDITGNGSAGQPFKTIAKAFTVATSGTTVSLAGGVYEPSSETFPITVPDGVSVVGAGAASTQIIGGANSAYGHLAVYLGNNASLSDVTVQNASGFGVWIANAGTVSNCTIKNSGIDAIEVVGTGNATVTNCTIMNNTYDGVWFQDTATGTVTSNTMSANGYRAVAAYYTPGPIQVSSNTLVGNSTSGSTTYGISSAQILLYSVSGTTLSGNSLAHTATAYDGKTGIYAYGLTSSTISGNTVAGFHPYFSYGLFIRGGSTPAVAGNIVTMHFRGIRLMDGGTNPTVSSNSVMVGFAGIRASSGTGTFRANVVTGQFDLGVYLSGSGSGDFGTPVNAGGNTFQNLATGCANFRNSTAAAVNAYGNTWDNSPPTVVNGSTCTSDIEQNPGLVNH